jgi:hypothetical protein
MMWRSATLAGVRAIARREIEAAPAYREDGEFPPNPDNFIGRGDGVGGSDVSYWFRV